MKENNEETRRERFKRVAERRTNEILNRIRILGNCYNRSAYSYNDQEVQKIFSTIEKELRFVKAKFSKREKNNFRL